MTDALLIDVSWANGPINAVTAWNAGARGALVKASDANKTTGQPYEDSLFKTHTANFAAHGKFLLDFWHYFQPKFDPIAQARFFCDLVRKQPRSLRPGIDIEEEASPGAGPGISPDEYANKIKAWLDEVERQLSVRGMIYTRMEYWHRCVAPRAYWKDYPLWVARHNPDWPGPWLNSDPVYYKPRSGEWVSWTFWQKSGTGNRLGPHFGSDPALSHDMDVNVFNGGYQQLLEFAGMADPIPKIVQVAKGVGTVARTGPGSGKQVAIFPYTCRLAPVAEKTNSNGVAWYQVGTGLFVRKADVVAVE